METERQKHKVLTKVENHRQREGLSALRKNCDLCDLEKFYIISRPELASLNQRNELATSCRHRKEIKAILINRRWVVTMIVLIAQVSNLDEHL